MPFIHVWKQRRHIRRHGEQVRWWASRKCEDENNRYNYQNENSTLAADYADPLASFHVENGFMYEEQSVADPDTAPVAALAGTGAGNIPNGTHRYGVSFVTRYGETGLSPAATVAVTDATANGKVALSSIPVASTAAVVARRVYRARVNGAGETLDYRLVAEIPDNLTSSYLDNVSPADLGDNPPDLNTTYPFLLIQNFHTRLDMIGSDGFASVVSVGNADVAFHEDTTPLSRGDKIQLIHPVRRLTAKEVLQRSNESYDRLGHIPARELVRVLQRDATNADYLPGVDCEIGEDERSLSWTGESPREGEMYSVEYKFAPTLYFLNQDSGVSHPSVTGEPMYRTGKLVQKHPESLAPAGG